MVQIGSPLGLELGLNLLRLSQTHPSRGSAEGGGVPRSFLLWNNMKFCSLAVAYPRGLLVSFDILVMERKL